MPVISTPITCPDCGRTEAERKFVKGKHLCLDCNAKRNRKYRQGNIPKYTARRAKYLQANFANWFRVMLISLRSTNRKKRKDLQFKIALDDLLIKMRQQKSKCALTGLQMSHKLGDLRAASVDRIDSAGGYTPDNIQIVCKAINLAKNTSTNKEMTIFIREIRAIS